MPHRDLPYRTPIAKQQIKPDRTLILEAIMPDVVFVVLGLAWFAVCLGYAAFCERL